MTTTYTIKATAGRDSTTVTTKGAKDFVVTVTMSDGTSVEGETTLIPSEWNGVLAPWGMRDNWMTWSLNKLANDLDGDGSDDGKDLCSAIAAACQTGEEQTLEIEEVV